MDEQAAVTALAALAQGMRLRVFRALVGAGPGGLTPGALCQPDHARNPVIHGTPCDSDPP